MALTRLLLAIIVLSAALLSPCPAAAQNPVCDLSGILPEPLRVLLGVPWVQNRTVDVDGHTLSLRFCAPMSQSVIAEDMLNLAVRALPVLDELTDVRLDGSLFRTIYMDESQRVYSRGADGYINTQSNQITLHERSWDSTVIHELAHYWADPQRFGEPWMVEAYAEYLTSLAAPQLGVSYISPSPTAACDGLPLQRWRSETTATEICAYSVGAEVLHALADRAGADPLREVIGQLSLPPLRVNSELLLTRLEQASSTNLTPLMQGRVFGPEADAELSKRSAVREHFIAATSLAASLGINPLTMIADDLNAWRHDAAADKLARLDPLLSSSDATRRRCEELQLACVHPWERISPDPATWPALSEALAAAPQLLTVYEELRTAAGALSLSLPAGFQDAAASLSLEGLSRLQAASVALTQARQLDEQCAALGLSCQAHWLPAWERGDVEAVGTVASEFTGVLSEATKLEMTCSDLVQNCRQLWREALNTWGAAAARRTIEELGTLFADGARIEGDCKAAGWPCGAGWRGKFSDGDPAAARELLTAQAVALPDLVAIERQINAPHGTGPMLPVPVPNGLGGQARLEEARAAFTNGDVAGAKDLAEAALNHRQLVRLWAPLTVVLVVLVAVGVVLLIWTRRRRRIVVSLAGQQSAASKPAQSKPSGTSSDLLSQLLSLPPDERGPRR